MRQFSHDSGASALAAGRDRAMYGRFQPAGCRGVISITGSPAGLSGPSGGRSACGTWPYVSSSRRRTSVLAALPSIVLTVMA
jgi:hypothetical protein